jgi:hypothetical protein
MGELRHEKKVSIKSKERDITVTLDGEPIFSICFLTDNERSERLTMSIKKKFTFTTSDGNPISAMLEPYTCMFPNRFDCRTKTHNPI